MKKLLLTTTAVAGFAMVATPALADGLSLDLGGFYRGYAVHADSDLPAGVDEREIDLRHDAEIHFTGETTLDSGLTVGVHSEMDLANDVGPGNDTLDEVYAYFSGSWGRINMGQEDGAQYLLQVAAPSADSNVDGLRTNIQAINLPASIGVGVGAIGGLNAAVLAAGQYNVEIDYAMDMAERAEKITYLTPKFSGFQGGISYTPELSDDAFQGQSVGQALTGNAVANNAGQFDDVWEVAARWDGEFEGVGLALGAGYGKAGTEQDAAAGLIGSDDRTQWNVGATANFAGFDLGGAYTEDDHGVSSDAEETTWVIGAGWDNGPYHAGISYMEKEYEVAAGTAETDLERITVGGTYTFGPGMSFRGAVAFGEYDAAGTANDRDFTQITLGTDVAF